MGSNNNTPRSWQLVADVGGTNARFARLAAGQESLLDITSIGVAAHSSFIDALSEFLNKPPAHGTWKTMPDAAVFALACRVDDEEISFTNSPWRFTRSAVMECLGGAPVTFINDFAATGYGVSQLSRQDWQQVGGNEPVEGKPVVVLGPGTGLGVSIVVPVAEGMLVVDGEGGHVDFAPVTEEEIRVLEILTSRFGRVSVERLLCGAGIVNIYRALAQMEGSEAPLQTAEAVSSAGVDDRDPLATRTMQLFCRVLGSVAGNLALTAGALGGVYIAGGIVPGMLDFLMASDFRRRFEEKGRFRDYLSRIPVRVVTRQDLGLIGAARKLRG